MGRVTDELVRRADGSYRLRKGSEVVAAHLDVVEAQARTDVLAPTALRVLTAAVAAMRTLVSTDGARLDTIARAGADPVALFGGPVPTAAALGVDDGARARAVHVLMKTGWLVSAPGAPGRYRVEVGQPVHPSADATPGRAR